MECGDGKVPVYVGVPDGGEAGSVQRGRQPGRVYHRAADGASVCYLGV